MALALPELLGEFQKADSKQIPVMFLDRKIVPIQEVVRVPSSPYILLCDRSLASMRTSFTESEKGLIGHCAAVGLGDRKIAKMLGRTVESIERVRKKLGV